MSESGVGIQTGPPELNNQASLNADTDRAPSRLGLEVLETAEGKLGLRVIELGSLGQPLSTFLVAKRESPHQRSNF